MVGISWRYILLLKLDQLAGAVYDCGTQVRGLGMLGA